MRRTILLIAAAIVVTGCRGGTASTSAPPTAPTTVDSTAESSTTVTTTTAAPVTTTTAVSGVHPVIESPPWDDVWPADGATATYQVVPYPDATEEVEALIEYGVDYRGQTLDRLVFGPAVPGDRGMIVYFDRTEPWVFKVVAVEVFGTGEKTGPLYVERFEAGMEFDGRNGVGESSESQGVLISEYPDGSADEYEVGYRATTTTDNGTIEVPYGTVEGVLHIGVNVGFPVAVDGEFAAELWLHPELFLVRMIGSPGWRDIQLVTPFG